MVARTLIAATLVGGASIAAAANIWQPQKGARWNMQLDSVPTTAQAQDDAFDVWDFDGTNATPELIKKFHDNGKKVICYFSAGSTYCP